MLRLYKFLHTWSGAGKTSLVNTLTSYIKNPTENPESVLTEDNEDLIETKVLQIYDDITLKNKKLSVTVDESSNPKLVSFRKAVEEVLDPNNSKRQSLKIMDLGGHTQSQGGINAWAASELSLQNLLASHAVFKKIRQKTAFCKKI